ncbi:unnamed protein product, partial [Porites evermanni]
MPLTFDILSDIQAFIIPTCDDDTRRQVLTLYTAHSRRSVCAGWAMQKNLALQHRFGMFDKATDALSDQRPVSKISLVSFISHLPRLVSIDPSHHSGHSFRIEGATSASIAGLTDYEIKLLGRWNSDSYE